MKVGIVTVGDELLVGATVNTNAVWLAEQLTSRGCTVDRITTLPDRISDIAHVVNEYRADYDAVIVTGGLGPTPDDLTMEGVAAALGRETVDHDAAREWLTEHGGYSADDLAEGTAELPAGARMLPNEVGVAPGAVVDSIYVLPGVPAEMKAMFEAIADEFVGEPIYTETVVADEPESALVDRLRAVREEFDVSVGSYPGEYVRVKFSSTDSVAVEAAANWFEARVQSPDSESTE
jgi:molybdenum cofactor synthesis domain-containing protein